MQISPSGEEAITRTSHVIPESIAAGTTGDDLEASYEIRQTVEYILQNGFTKVTLQFPDELLHDSVPVHQTLKSCLPPDNQIEIFVLADTTYGSCCVDEVAASHVDADVVVHYGHTCLSRTSRLPVIYVFGKKPLRPEHAAQSLLDAVANDPYHERNHVVLFHDVAYMHQIDAVHEHLLKAPKPERTVHFTPFGENRLVQPATTYSASLSRLSLPPDVDPSECIIFYIGGESLGLNNILISNGTVPVYSYDPTNDSTRLESTRSNKMLMRRYAMMQMARDADVFGILVGTLGVASYLPLINHLRSRVTKARRKAYTLAVGKLNPAKLANFPEIECFVLVACPENSIVESKEFSKPIVTPYELELALQPEPTWNGKLVLDFDQVMAEEQVAPNVNDIDDDPDRPGFSLITGKYRDSKYRQQPLQDSSSTPTSNSTVATRSTNTAIAARDTGTIGDYLQTRSWKGLEMRLGQDEPSSLEQGRSGIAKGYSEES